MTRQIAVRKTKARRGIRRQASLPAQLVGEQHADPDERDHDVEVKPLPLGMRRAGFDKYDPEHSARRDQQPSRAGNKASLPQNTEEGWNQENRGKHSAEGV